jgi:hypothetical protein
MLYASRTFQDNKIRCIFAVSKLSKLGLSRAIRTIQLVHSVLASCLCLGDRDIVNIVFYNQSTLHTVMHDE